MSWQDLRDPDNPENNAAGNRSDWLKHTIWLAGLTALQRCTPNTALELHSCHAGRGMYRIPPADARLPHLHALWCRSPDPLLLQQAQRAVCHGMGVHPSKQHWYAGSALLFEWWRRQQQHSPSDHHYLYEWHPDTRAVLAATLSHFGQSTTSRLPTTAVNTHIVARDTHGGGRFDGESAVAEALHRWPAESVLLLDPFALWRHPKHAERRARFVRIFEAVAARGHHAPAVSLFFAWGKRTSAAARSAAEVSDDYVALREQLRTGPHTLVEMHWCWDLRCGMWWLLPSRYAQPVAAAVNYHVGALLARFGDAQTSWHCTVSPRASLPPAASSE